MAMQVDVQVPAQISQEPAPPLDKIVSQAAAHLEANQEALLLQKYGGIKPKKHLLKNKKSSRKCFDSADWALAKLGKTTGEALEQPIESLPVKLQPTTPTVPRRNSHLGDC